MWCKHAVEELQAGREAIIHPRGNSMRPKVVSGAEVKLSPVDEAYHPKKGDIVLVRVRGKWYLHLVTAVEKNRVQIGNNRGHINGWVSQQAIAGIAIKIDNQ